LDVDWFYRLFFLAVLLVLSALFSGSEVALFSIKKNKLKNLDKDRRVISRYIADLLEHPRRLLVTILLGNTLINVAASILAVTLALDTAKYYDLSVDLVLIIEIILLTILILMFGEITPKVLASKHPLKYARAVAIPLYWISVFIYPVSVIISDLIKILLKKVKYDKSKTAILSSELTELADIGIEKGTIEEEEHELIHGLVSFKTVTVREVMTPRVDVTAVSYDTKLHEIMKLITESGHSRIPLYGKNLDNILGIIYAKDLLPYLSNNNGNKDFSLGKIVREAIFVPETKLINVLLKEFQEKNLHVGIVVDEYGGTAGLISLEDILEEIVGEIRDEFDKEENEITKINDGEYLLLGKVSIDELNELFNYDFSSEEDDYETIGGFIFKNAGKIPKEGYSFMHDKFRFTVKAISNKRINKVNVQKMDERTEK